MLQQTQVPRVIPKWQAFLDAFPTPAACAAASLGDVLRLWQGLGYPRRARNLHAAADARRPSSGGFPTTLEALLRAARRRAVHGAGRAGVRLRARRGGGRHQHRPRARPGRRPTADAARQVQAAADAACCPRGDAWAWNQSIMDLGAMRVPAGEPGVRRLPGRAPMCAWRRRRRRSGGRIGGRQRATGSVRRQRPSGAWPADAGAAERPGRRRCRLATAMQRDGADRRNASLDDLVRDGSGRRDRRHVRSACPIDALSGAGRSTSEFVICGEISSKAASA